LTIEKEISKHDIVTQNFLRYTFLDVFSSRFKASYAYTVDAALVASILHINQLECFSSFFPLKTEVVFLKAVKSMGQTATALLPDCRASPNLPMGLFD
jgi:hypothetical protein